MIGHMGLRARLALFFVAITIVPLTVAVVALQRQIANREADRIRRELVVSTQNASIFIEAARARASDLAADLVARDIGRVYADADPEAAQRWLDAQLRTSDPQRADIALLADADGRVLAVKELDEPRFPAVLGDLPPDPEAIAAAASHGQELAGVVLAGREVLGSPAGSDNESRLGWVVTGVWTDRDLLRRATTGPSAFVDDGRVLATWQASEATAIGVVPPVGVSTGTVNGREAYIASVRMPTLGTGTPATTLVQWRVADETAEVSVLTLVLVVAGGVAGLLGWYLAGTVVAPVRRAADVARAVAGGDLRRTLEPTGGAELADLARALNTMSADLQTRLSEIERSRDELRRSLSRLGMTLSSSLDLNRILSVVVETAMESLQADRAVLMMFTPEHDALYPKVGRGVGDRLPRLALGEGLAGHIALTGSPVRLPADLATAPSPAPGEPAGRHYLAVPMHGRGRVIGVLALMRDEPADEFSVTDVETIQTFTAQASVAIENVMLHQEAQRLSITDGLTGLWNFRYFQQQADRELESAARFSRDLSLVILDIDHFKSVNDTYGHQAGDDVLCEVARRIRDSVRIPDIVARYGGEEFIVLLPGTGLEGAVATAERIRHAIGGTPIEVTRGFEREPGGLRVSASLGVASFGVHGRTVSALLRNADAAMYSAKTSGRDRVVAADADLVASHRGGDGDTDPRPR